MTAVPIAGVTLARRNHDSSTGFSLTAFMNSSTPRARRSFIRCKPLVTHSSPRTHTLLRLQHADDSPRLSRRPDTVPLGRRSERGRSIGGDGTLCRLLHTGTPGHTASSRFNAVPDRDSANGGMI